MPQKFCLFPFSVLAGGLLRSTPSSDCLVCDVLTVPWMLGTASNEPWRSTDLLPDRGHVDLQHQPGRDGQSLRDSAGPSEQWEDPRPKPTIGLRGAWSMGAQAVRVQTPRDLFVGSPSPEAPSSVSHCTMLKLLKGTGHLRLCYGKPGVKLMKET